MNSSLNLQRVNNCCFPKTVRLRTSVSSAGHWPVPYPVNHSLLVEGLTLSTMEISNQNLQDKPYLILLFFLQFFQFGISVSIHEHTIHLYITNWNNLKTYPIRFSLICPCHTGWRLIYSCLNIASFQDCLHIVYLNIKISLIWEEPLPKFAKRFCLAYILSAVRKIIALHYLIWSINCMHIQIFYDFTPQIYE